MSKPARQKLPTVGTIITRQEAPTVRYRVTSTHGKGANAYARCLPFRTSGREVCVMILGATIAGDGSVWTATGEIVK